jgi:predicted nucleotidyltransferase
VALKLENIVWLPTPIMEQQLIVSALKQKRHFGARIKRGLNNVMTAEKLIQTAWTAATVAPATPSFLLRARIVQFDTENNVRGAKGYVFSALTEAKAEIS